MKKPIVKSKRPPVFLSWIVLRATLDPISFEVTNRVWFGFRTRREAVAWSKKVGDSVAIIKFEMVPD